MTPDRCSCACACDMLTMVSAAVLRSEGRGDEILVQIKFAIDARVIAEAMKTDGERMCWDCARAAYEGDEQHRLGLAQAEMPNGGRLQDDPYTNAQPWHGEKSEPKPAPPPAPPEPVEEPKKLSSILPAPGDRVWFFADRRSGGDGIMTVFEVVRHWDTDGKVLMAVDGWVIREGHDNPRWMTGVPYHPEDADGVHWRWRGEERCSSST